MLAPGTVLVPGRGRRGRHGGRGRVDVVVGPHDGVLAGLGSVMNVCVATQTSVGIVPSRPQARNT